MAKKFDLVVKTGTYKKDGQDKARYKNVGVMLEGENGPYILLDRTFNPAGIQSDKDTIIVSLYEPKKKENYAQDEDFDSTPF